MFAFDKDSGELWIYDEIGPSWWGLIDASAVIGALKEIGDQPVTVRLNTPGGSVDEGVAIYNALKSHKAGVTTVVDSLAASMGSYILQAGSTRRVASNAMVMVHDPWSIALGNANELRKTADVLDKYAARMVPDYARRSGKTDDEIKAIMQEEGWYTGQDAVDEGFADELVDASDVEPVVAGLRHLSRKPPESLIGRQFSAGDRTRFPQREKARNKRIMTIAEAKAKVMACQL